MKIRWSTAWILMALTLGGHAANRPAAQILFAQREVQKQIDDRKTQSDQLDAELGGIAGPAAPGPAALGGPIGDGISLLGEEYAYQGSNRYWDLVAETRKISDTFASQRQEQSRLLDESTDRLYRATNTIASLTTLVPELMGEVNALERKLADLRRNKAAASDINSCQKDLSAAQQKFAEAQVRLRQAEQDKYKADQGIAAANARLDQIDQDPALVTARNKEKQRLEQDLKDYFNKHGHL